MPINNFDSIMPPFLKMGDQIEIVASAKFVSKEDILDATEVIANYGFKIKHNSHLFVKKNVFAGTVQQRIDSLQNALDDKDTKAIFFARGGYGSIQIIDHIDFSVFEKRPKWLVGFSDITTILIHVQQQYNISCIHGPMPFNFKKTNSKTLNKLFELLTGQLKDIKVRHHNFNKVDVPEEEGL